MPSSVSSFASPVNIQSSYSGASLASNKAVSSAADTAVQDKLDLSQAALALIDKNAAAKLGNNQNAKLQAVAVEKTIKDKIDIGNDIINSLNNTSSDPTQQLLQAASAAQSSSEADVDVGANLDVVV